MHTTTVFQAKEGDGSPHGGIQKEQSPDDLNASPLYCLTGSQYFPAVPQRTPLVRSFQGLRVKGITGLMLVGLDEVQRFRM